MSALEVVDVDVFVVVAVALGLELRCYVTHDDGTWFAWFLDDEPLECVREAAKA